MLAALEKVFRRLTRPEEASESLVLVWNPLPWKRTEVAERLLRLPQGWVGKELEVIDASGRILPSHVRWRATLPEMDLPHVQRSLHPEEQEALFSAWRRDFEGSIERRRQQSSRLTEWVSLQFLAKDLPALGYRAYTVRVAQTRTPGARKAGSPGAGRSTPVAQEHILENEFLRVDVHDDGSFDLMDKRTGWLLEGLNVFEDREDAGDEYDYSPAPQTEVYFSKGLKGRREVLESSALGGKIRVQLDWALPVGLTPDRQGRAPERVSCPLTVDIGLREGEDWVTVNVRVDNRVRDHRLRVLFPTDVNTDFSLAETPFDVCKRPLEPPEGKDWVQKPVNTHPQRGFVCIEDGQKGVAVFNKGLPEYEVYREGGQTVVALTLFRSVGWLSRDDLLTREGHAGPPEPTPDAQCLGEMDFQYAICPYKGSWLAADIPRKAARFRLPPVVLQELPWLQGKGPKSQGPAPEEQGLLEVEAPEVLLMACKREEDGKAVILRLFNYSEASVRASVRFGRPLHSLEETKLNERRLRHLELTDPYRVELAFRPREIKTLAVTFK